MKVAIFLMSQDAEMPQAKALGVLEWDWSPGRLDRLPGTSGHCMTQTVHERKKASRLGSLRAPSDTKQLVKGFVLACHKEKKSS